MRFLCGLLVFALAAPANETVIRARRSEQFLILTEVYLNGRGPFRMLIDTGAASCTLRPHVAAQLGVQAAYRVERATAASSSTVPAVVLDEIRVGPVSTSRVEALVADVAWPGTDGVLGQSWLLRHDYLLDFRNARLVLDPVAPESGIRIALRSSDGRPMLAAEVNGSRQELVLDSGASALLLFGASAARSPAAITTNNGTIAATQTVARLQIGPAFRRFLPAATIEAPLAPGLLPASTFASVYISNRDGIIVLVPR